MGGGNYIVCPHSYIPTNGLYGALPLFISPDWTSSYVRLNKNILGNNGLENWTLTISFHIFHATFTYLSM
jgi:hypothetical protein